MASSTYLQFPHPLFPFAFASCFVIICLATFIRRRSYPPGPRGALFFGHAFRIPAKRPWVAFAEWGRDYGPIYTVSFPGKPFIIANSFQAANDLFTRRSRAFSSRRFRMMAYLSGYDRALAFMSPGPAFRTTRRQMYGALNVTATQSHYPLQEREARRFALRLSKDHSRLRMDIRRLASTIMFAFAIGYSVQSDDDPLVVLSEEVNKNAALLLTPGKFWVDLFPFLKHVNIPLWAMGKHVSRSVHKFREDLQKILDLADSHVQKCMQDSDAPLSYASRLLKDTPEKGAQEHMDLVNYANVSMYGGAVDTTIAIIESFFLAMIMHPEIQTKAQDEIDLVVGHERLPSLADRQSLPYVNAILTELLRWNPPTPLTSRYMKQDEYYQGYLLPSGSTVVANLWAMTHDESRFPDPHVFRPERFFHDGEPQTNILACTDDPAADPYRIVFGFGRRFCPGARFAASEIWIAMSTVLATFCIHAPVRPDGTRLVPMLDCEEGGLVKVHPYEYRLEPRSSKAIQLLCQVEES